MDGNGKGVSPIHVGMALKSLRNSDFDAYSAICEIVDNSIEAKCSEIKIKIEEAIPDGKRVPRPTRMIFGDDGEGMDSETLQSCLKLGYSGRYDSRKGIGRFGVGMTFGAISLCEKIEVYSRQKRGNWQYTYLDIHDISPKSEPIIHEIENMEPPKDIEDLVGDYGTLVIWSKIDRVESDFKREILMHKLGRIYRKMIGKEIISNKKIVENNNMRKIVVNETPVTTHDPLYATRNPKFPDDKRASLEDDMTFEWKVHPVDAPSSGEVSGNITIRTSLLPASWRKERQYSGRSTHNNDRKVWENEGISILRNGREVFYDVIPHFRPGKETLDRFWGCEVDFDATLDHWFSVKNIKLGARPLKELREELQNKLQATILNHLRDRIQEDYDRSENEKTKINQGPIKGHKGAEENLKNLVTPIKTTVTKEEIDRNIDKHAKETFDTIELQEEYKKELKNPEINYKIIENYESRPDGPFIDVLDNVGKKVVHYNMRHPFFMAIYKKINEIKKIAEENNPANTELLKTSSELKDDLDNLIYAYAEGIYNLNDLTKKQEIRETIEDHRNHWGYYLRKTYKQG